VQIREKGAFAAIIEVSRYSYNCLYEAYSGHLMPSVSKTLANHEPSNSGSRLDGWKEIAAYLGRGERTVKRWEAQRGLPTHRIPGDGRRSVFAYAAELDEWLRSSGGQAASQDEPEALMQDTVPEIAAANGRSRAEDAGGQASVIDPRLNSSALETAPPRRAQMRGLSGLWALCGVILLALALAFFPIDRLRRHGRGLVAAASPHSALNQPAAPGTVAPVASNPDKAVAHDLYLKGRYEWNQRTPESLNRAVDSFTQAIVHDPNYAEAYVGLAETYALLREFSTMPDSDAFSRSLAAARKAVELDSSLAEAHRALAFAEMYGSLDFTDAEKEFHRAIALDPRDPAARRWYANAFAVPGRFEECLAQMDLAQALDPASHATLADKGWMLFLAGRREEGIRTLREVERSVPEFVSPHSYLMQIGFELRDYPTFLDEGERMAAAKSDSAFEQVLAAARRGYELHGEAGLLQALHAQGQVHRSNSDRMSTLLAKVCVRMGRNQEALQILEDEYTRRDPDVLSCLSHPSLLMLRDEPRYKALVKKINFPAHAADASNGYLVGTGAARVSAIATPAPLHA
jgi:tetratricopeptide (TPR) repeat protein